MHRYRPSPVPLSGTGKKKGQGVRGGLPALAGTREYKQSDWNWNWKVGNILYTTGHYYPLEGGNKFS